MSLSVDPVSFQIRIFSLQFFILFFCHFFQLDYHHHLSLYFPVSLFLPPSVSLSLQVPWNPEVDVCWHSLVAKASEECEPEWCDSEDPLFILYTSGSTGRPKVTTNTHIVLHLETVKKLKS